MSFRLKKVCLLSDMDGIWFKTNVKFFDFINRKVGIRKEKEEEFNKILKKNKKLARIGKMSTFLMGLLPYQVLEYKDAIFRRAEFMDLEIKYAKKIYLLQPNAKKVLKKIYRNVSIIGISDSPLSGDRLKIILSKIGILKYFNSVFTSHDLGCEKPKAFSYFEDLKRSCEVFFLGHESDEILGAKKFGFKTIGLRNKNGEVYIKSLTGLIKLFGRRKI